MKPNPTYDILDKEIVENFINSKKRKSFYFLSYDDIIVVPKYILWKNKIFGGVKLYSDKEFLKENIDVLRNNLTIYITQILSY